MEEHFPKIVEHVFNNWTALKLAVEHSMGGPNSKQTAVECMNYMIQYCLYEPNVQVEDIQEALEDILDQEFDTVCEDGSPKEVSQVLFKFLKLLQEGNVEQYENELHTLPIANHEWINVAKLSEQSVIINEESSEDESTSNAQVPMEQDTEWTQVKSRRKK